MTNPSNSILFTDDCWPTSLVNAINEVITSDKTAIQMWNECTALVTTSGEYMESAPRDLLLSVLDARGTRGFNRLARRFGYIPRGLDAIKTLHEPE